MPFNFIYYYCLDFYYFICYNFLLFHKLIHHNYSQYKNFNSLTNSYHIQSKIIYYLINYFFFQIKIFQCHLYLLHHFIKFLHKIILVILNYKIFHCFIHYQPHFSIFLYFTNQFLKVCSFLLNNYFHYLFYNFDCYSH